MVYVVSRDVYDMLIAEYGEGIAEIQQKKR